MKIILEAGKKYMTDKGHEVTIEKVRDLDAIAYYIDDDGDHCYFTLFPIVAQTESSTFLEMQASILTNMLVDARTKIVELEVELETLKNAKR